MIELDETIFYDFPSMCHFHTIAQKISLVLETLDQISDLSIAFKPALV